VISVDRVCLSLSFCEVPAARAKSVQKVCEVVAVRFFVEQREVVKSTRRKLPAEGSKRKRSRPGDRKGRAFQVEVLCT
jgi:hypothetical protein